MEIGACSSDPETCPFRRLVDNLADGMVYQIDSGPDGKERRFSYISSAVERMHGLSSEEVLRAPGTLYGQVLEEDRLRVAAIEAERAQDLTPLSVEVRVCLPSGEIRWRQFTSAPRRLENGRLVWDGIEIDITDSKEVVLALLESERLLRESQRVARVGHYVLDISAETWTSSETLDEIFGIDGAVKRTVDLWERVLHPEDREMMTRYFNEEIIWRGQPFDRRYRIRRLNDSEDRWVHGLGRLAFAADGRPTRMFGTIQDVTDLCLAEQERHRLFAREQEARRAAEEAVKARDEFLSIASHELKTPLGALTIQVEGMEKLSHAERLENGLLESGLALIGRQTRRLIRLVESLLTVSRLHADRLELDRRPVDLDRLVADVLERHSPELDKAACRTLFQRDGAINGCWDGHRIEQIVENLLTNAAKFGAGKPIAIAVTSDGATARLTMTDEGVGVPENLHDRIFERFERGDAQRHVGGLGMGLYIARRIAEAHGGSLCINSAPGAGATFILELPLAP